MPTIDLDHDHIRFTFRAIHSPRFCLFNFSCDIRFTDIFSLQSFYMSVRLYYSEPNKLIQTLFINIIIDPQKYKHSMQKKRKERKIVRMAEGLISQYKIFKRKKT